MESRTSSHHNRKFSNAFSGINPYSDMFPGPANLGAQQDYNLIFGNSNASSIPVLDLSEDTRFVDFSSSKLDYSDIFRGFNDDEPIGVSYQDLTNSSDNVRTQSATRYPLNSSDRSTFPGENQLFTSEASFQSFDDKKHFKMSYHKTSVGSKDGSNGTTHVAQFHPEPGFTLFVDDSTAQESKANKPDPSVTSDIRRKLDFSDGILESKDTKKSRPHRDTQKSNRGEGNSRTGLYEGGSYSSDRLLNAHGTNLTQHPTKERMPPRVTANLENDNGYPKRSTGSNSEAPKGIASQDATDDSSLPFFGEEFDVNSDAAVSAAALKDAIQKAQESIRIAKEMMERKMGGLGNRSNRVFKEGLRAKDRKENSIKHEGNRTKNKNAKDAFETVDSVPNNLSGRWKSALRRGQDAPDFKENEITFTIGKVISDVHAQDRAKTEKREPALSTILNVGKNRTSLSSPDQQEVGNRGIAQLMDKHESNANERNITKKALMKQEIIVVREEEDEKAHELGSIRKKLHADVMENESSVNEDKFTKHVEMKKPLIFQEDADCVKTGIESQQKIEYESHVLMDTGFEKTIHIIQKQDQSKHQANTQQEDIEKTTAHFDEEHEYRPRIICDEDIEEERFEDAFEWVQNEFEPNDFLGSVINEKEQSATHMAEVTEKERRLAKILVPTYEEKILTDVHDYKESGKNFGEFKLKASENTFRSHGYAKNENTQFGTNEIQVLQHARYDNGVIREVDSWSHDASDNVTKTQGARQPCMIDESRKTKPRVNDTSKSIDKATNNVYDYKVGEEEEKKVAMKLNKIEPFEIASLVQGGAEDSESRNNMKTVFDALPSEGSIPKVGLIDLGITNSEAEHRGKDFESNINPNNDARTSVSGSSVNDAFDEEAVKSCPHVSNGEGHVGIIKNLEAYSGPSVSSENEKVIQIDDEVRARQNTQMNGRCFCKTIAGEEEEAKSDEEIKTDNIVEVNEDTPQAFFAMEETGIKKAKSNGSEENEYLRKKYEESKRERQREIERIAVRRAIQEARDRAFAGAKEKAERAAVERATAEVRQRVMAEARGKLEKATTAVKPSDEKALLEAKRRSERAAVERATAEARERALEKALSQKTTSGTQVLHRPDDTYIESAQRSKARLERQERIMERVAKALAEKNMRDLLAQKEEAEKNRLAESLDTEIKRWSTGKEGNLRALLSTLQYILGPGSGWQPISLTDIVTSNAVKKAYRKATLYVHPDKLQQRRASIREKYICEKVFDLLKVACNKFSSEER